MSDIKNETLPWRTFSIFISSTFSDMQAERDHLKNMVIPRIEEELQKKRIKIEIIDLRWGVDTTSMEQEDEREANVLKVCFDEIRRCRPFFIGLLGDRYGWVPPLERIKTALVGEKNIVPVNGKSVTDLEIEFGVLASHEQLMRSVFYFRDPLPYETFSNKKAAMFCDGYNHQLSELEKKERKSALEKLKTNIRNHFEKLKLGSKVKTYSGAWDYEKEKLTGLETWGDTVYTDILAECESHAKETWDKAPQNWQEQELALLDAFIENNTTTFCGRKSLIETLKQHMISDDSSNWGFVLTGESGSGKSAVFSMIVKEMQQEDCFILAHSAGLSPRAKSISDLLQIWNMQLAEAYGIEEELNDDSKNTDGQTLHLTGEHGKAPSTSIEKLQEKFLELLQIVSAKIRVVLLIDALDRFEPTARAQHLSWLPGLMPRNVRLLCTAIIGTEQKAVQYHKGLNAKSIDIFSATEAKEMLLALCTKQHKTLPGKVEKIILEKKRDNGQPATVSPLWLSLAVNILMALDNDDFEKINLLEGRGDQQIESYMTEMANGFDPLPGPLFMSLKNKSGLLFGETFVDAIFNNIAISRNGLREKDLEKILPLHNIDWDPLQFANLRRWFKTHLILQGEELQWNLAHSILKNTIMGKLAVPEIKKMHLSAANHLLSLSDADTLKISETMYHLMRADKMEMAANYYANYWLNTPQTEGSSKVLAESVIMDEALNETCGLDWIISLIGFINNQDFKLRTLLNNLIFSLFDKYLQSYTSINYRTKLILAVSLMMEELCHRDPNSVDYARELTISYDRLGDLYLQSGDSAKAIDNYKAVMTILEKLCHMAPDSDYLGRDLFISYKRLGDLYLKLGDNTKALEKYDRSLSTLEDLHNKFPDSVIYTRDLSVLNNKLGDMFFYLGDHAKALDMYNASLSISEELHFRYPDSRDYTRDLSLSFNNLGDMYLNLGDPIKALDKFQKAMIIREELHQTAPESAIYKRDLSVSFSKLGDLYFQLGDIPEAFDKYKASLILTDELFQRVHDSADYAYNLSISYDKMGDVYLKLGDLVKALDNYQSGMTLWEGLHNKSPDIVDYARGVSASYTRLGDLFFKLGDFPKALKKHMASMTIIEELHHKAPSSADYASDLSISYDRLGDIYLKLGDTTKALEKYMASMIIAEELHIRSPESTIYAHTVNVSYIKLGDLYFKLGDTKKALEKYIASLAIAEKLHQSAPNSVSISRDLSISNGRLGNVYLNLEDISNALDKYLVSMAITQGLHQSDINSTTYTRDLYVSFNNLGDVYLKMGDNSKALDKYQESLIIAEELRQQDPKSVDYASDVYVSSVKLGDLLFRSGDPTSAIDKYQVSLSILEDLNHRNSNLVDYNKDIAVLYGKLGALYKQTGKEEDGNQFLQKFISIVDIMYKKTKNPEYQLWLESVKVHYGIGL